jgi:hypothetical protein
LLLFGLYVGILFLKTTTFDITWPTYLQKDIRVFLLLLIVLRMQYGRRMEKRDVPVLILAFGVFFLSYNRRNDTALLDVILLIVGSRGISFRKLIQIYLAVTAGLLLFTNVAALLGKTTNLIYYQTGRRRRVSMGIIYPTDFAAHVFSCAMCYVYLRHESIRYLELLGLGLIGALTFYLTDARLNTICFALLVVVFAFHKWDSRRKEKKGGTYEMNRVWSVLLAVSPVLCGGFMILVSALYAPERKLLAWINRVLNSRLAYGNKAINLYGFTLWGQWLPSQGNGNTTAEQTHYFFLDSSYVNIVMYYGVVVLTCVLLMWLLIAFRARREKNWALLWIVAIYSVQCMVEHHMLEIAYNPFLWALLADTTKELPAAFLTYIRKKRGNVADET